MRILGFCVIYCLFSLKKNKLIKKNPLKLTFHGLYKMKVTTEPKREDKKNGKYRTMCHVNGSMAVKSFSQCKARTNCLSKQINLS